MERVNIFPYHTSEQPNEKQRINLFLISEDAENVHEDTDDNDEGITDENYDPDADYSTRLQKETKYHYCKIEDLNRQLYDQNNHKCKTYFCDRCLHGYTKEYLLIKHKEDCCGINKSSTRIEMPTEGRSHITFKSCQNQMPIPYVIYAEVESIITPKIGDTSEITSEHKACGFGYQV